MTTVTLQALHEASSVKQHPKTCIYRQLQNVDSIDTDVAYCDRVFHSPDMCSSNWESSVTDGGRSTNHDQ